MFEINEVTGNNQIQKIVSLAEIILPEYYQTIIPNQYLDFFLNTLQSEETILEQTVKKDFRYYLLSFDKNLAGYLGIRYAA